MKTLSQRTRLVILLLYIGALFCTSKLAFDSWLPPVNEKGLWFYSGLAAILLGNLLVTPFFTKPADAISNSVAAIIALLAVNIWSPMQYTEFDRFLWLMITLYSTSVLLAGILSITLKDSPCGVRQNISKTLYLFSDVVGSPKFIFSALFLFSIVTFHRTNSREYLILGIAWAVLVALKPLETFSNLIRQWWEIWKVSSHGERFGEIVGYEIPKIILIRHDPETKVSLSDILLLKADDGNPALAAVLDHVGFAEGRWLRAITLPLSGSSVDRISKQLSSGDSIYPVIVRTESKILKDPEIKALVDQTKSSLVGLVASDSDISQIQFEIIRTDIDISEGRLLKVEIGSVPTLYQIINGITREEIIQQKNTRGFVRGKAKKIGRWDDVNKHFEIVKWLPCPNSPVYLVDESSCPVTKESIGHFPRTNYPVTIDVDQLVTHNTAILGILGAGKSFLALELVERLIRGGIKVICLDLTNQYSKELTPYYNAETETSEIEELQGIGPSGKNNVQQNVEDGGSILSFKDKVLEKFRAFLNPENTDKYLKIFNPVQFEVWKQDSKPYQGRASMVSLTPTEITRLFTESALEVLQEQGMSEKAKCCLIYEEAHSLIPEWNAVASEGDRVATNGTAKAILQGRKYGLGCLVITQRTANVTKSILNQCNTVFALRVFDSTGMEFLKNYIGEDYAGVLSTLEDRHAIVFGRASSCRDPVLIRLNDRPDFVRVFRDEEDVNGTAGGGV